jgi:hypothetical protein
MSNLQLHYSEGELLETDAVVEPLVANGVHCHGGYAADGTYVSPRTKFRRPAITAWQQSHREQFGTEIIDAPIELWPGVYPSVEQTKYLLREGVAEPTISTLTRVGTVEGFGGLIRAVHPGNLQRFFDESIDGTALQHLDHGLFEAHARDEAGWEDEAGHNRMWFAARDIAFENPVTEDQTQIMLERMGINQGGAGPSGPAAVQLFPDLDPMFEMMLRRMMGLMFIEVSAFHTFAWAEDVLSDNDLVAGDGEAASIVACVRADETPHVDYLRTALTEVRDRTVIDTAGKKIPGRDIIQKMWDNGLAQSLGPNREQFRKTMVGEIEHALAGNPRRDAIMEGFHAFDTERVAS